MAWLALAMLSIVTLGYFADFILGPRGQRDIKDRLVAFYVQVAEGPWGDSLAGAACAVEAFFARVFGARIVSAGGLLRSILFSLLVTATVVVVALRLDQAFLQFIVSESGVQKLNTLNIVTILIVNTLIDVPALATTRVLARLMCRRGMHWQTGVAVLVQCFALYVFVSLVVLLSFSVMLTTAGTVILNAFPTWGSRISAAAKMTLHFVPIVFSNPWPADQTMRFGDTSLAIFTFAVIFPATLLLLTVLVTYLVIVSRPITQRPLSIVLERLEESPSGVFTKVAGALALVAGLVGALAKALG